MAGQVPAKLALGEQIYVVAGERSLLATASARVMPDQFPGSGYVHWVAADPAAQRMGLGTAMVVRVLRHFREAGLQDAVLETYEDRLPAIRCYLRLGFVPEYPGAEPRLIWARWPPQVVGTK
jgi:mycothiol synthase